MKRIVVIIFGALTAVIAGCAALAAAARRQPKRRVLPAGTEDRHRGTSAFESDAERPRDTRVTVAPQPAPPGGFLRAIGLATCVTLAVACVAAAALAGVSVVERRQSWSNASDLTGGGDPGRGEDAIERYGCASCHTIPGVRGADARVGPSLDKIGTRAYVGGVLANTPENLIHWIKDPPGVDAMTAMPKLGVSDDDARDIASYLYTLR